MNLKEAFRYQNTLRVFMNTIQLELSYPKNVMVEKKAFLRHKVDKDAEDEVVITPPSTEYAGAITELAMFLVWLGAQQEKLSAAIRETKKSLDVDIDSESGLNKSRQRTAGILSGMAKLRSSEVLAPNGGVGYRFNSDGNQVSYMCDVRTATTIDFDRNIVKKMAADLSKQADEVSNKIDIALVSSEVDYTPPFDVNENFEDVFEWFCETKGTE